MKLEPEIECTSTSDVRSDGLTGCEELLKGDMISAEAFHEEAARICVIMHTSGSTGMIQR